MVPRARGAAHFSICTLLGGPERQDCSVPGLLGSGLPHSQGWAPGPGRGLVCNVGSRSGWSLLPEAWSNYHVLQMPAGGEVSTCDLSK